MKKLLLIGGTLVGIALANVPQACAQIPVTACPAALSAPGSYQVTGPITTGVSCITITVSGVTLDLNGQTVTCAGPGFSGSCQVFGPGAVGITIGPGVTNVTVKGPGTLSGFDNGVSISNSNALVKGLTIVGPVGAGTSCPAPGACPRPDSTGIEVDGTSGVNLLANDVSGYADGIEMVNVTCPGGTASCVLNGNSAHDNFSDPIPCHGITFSGTTGYTATKNSAFRNGENGFENAGIYIVGMSTGNTITNNNSSNNLGFGIAASGVFGPSGFPTGNTIVNNVAEGNTSSAFYADLGEVSGSGPNTWNANNECETEIGTVPLGVCGPTK